MFTKEVLIYGIATVLATATGLLIKDAIVKKTISSSTSNAGEDGEQQETTE